MPYPGTFHRLVLIGNTFGDVWNTTMSIIPVEGTGLLDLGPVTSVELTAVAGAVDTWFRGTLPTGPSFVNAVKLTGIKLNRIGPDGKYVDPVTQEHVYPAPISGGGGTQGVAPQLTAVLSLLTAVERGRAAKGRMFMPPQLPVVAPSISDGRLTVLQAGQLANAGSTLIDAINDLYVTFESGDESRGRVGVASNVGAGQFRVVTKVAVGRVVDTMRSRRSSLLEDHQEAVVPAGTL